MSKAIRFSEIQSAVDDRDRYLDAVTRLHELSQALAPMVRNTPGGILFVRESYKFWVIRLVNGVVAIETIDFKWAHELAIDEPEAIEDADDSPEAIATTSGLDDPVIRETLGVEPGEIVTEHDLFNGEETEESKLARGWGLPFATTDGKPL